MKNLPNYLSAVRIVLSPVFLIVFMLPVWTDGSFACGSVVLCWILMFLMDKRECRQLHGFPFSLTV